MSQSFVCDWCITKTDLMQGCTISSEQAVKVGDYEPPPKIPECTICRDCADDLTEYIEERRQEEVENNHDSKTEPIACEWCTSETEVWQASTVVSEILVQYNDGPRPASIPSIQICRPCLNDLIHYVEDRQERSETPQTIADLELSHDELGLLLNLLRRGDTVMLQTGENFGIRYLDSEWKEAFTPVPQPPTIRTLDESEVIEKIESSREVCLRVVKESEWAQYEEI